MKDAIVSIENIKGGSYAKVNINMVIMNQENVKDNNSQKLIHHKRLKIEKIMI